MRLVSLSIIACFVSTFAYGQCDISRKVCTLSADFNPVPDGTYNPPQCTMGSTHIARIQTAFGASSAAFKTDLCSLTQIIIIPRDRGGDHSWGHWENPQFYPPRSDCPSNGCSYIGIVEDELSKDVGRVEQDHLDRALPGSGATHRHAPASSNPTPAATLGLISILAHEMAHIKFRRDGGRTRPCFDQDFVQRSWERDIGDTVTRRWLAFNDVIGTPKVPRPDANDRVGLENVYKGGHATLLANRSPEEDYVETYKIKQLMTARRPGQVIIVIPGRGSVQVNSDRGSQVLTNKMNCAS